METRAAATSGSGRPTEHGSFGLVRFTARWSRSCARFADPSAAVDLLPGRADIRAFVISIVSVLDLAFGWAMFTSRRRAQTRPIQQFVTHR